MLRTVTGDNLKMAHDLESSYMKQLWIEIYQNCMC